MRTNTHAFKLGFSDVSDFIDDVLYRVDMKIFAIYLAGHQTNYRCDTDG